MAQVLIKCPNTDKEVYTGLNMSWSELDSVELGEQVFRCPRCRETHTWEKEDAWLREDGGG